MRKMRVWAVLAAVAVAVACAGDPEVLKREFVARGDAYVAEGKYGEAVIEYRNALAQDAQFGEARLKLGRAYEEIGDGVNALAEYVRAADLMPDDLTAQAAAGRLLLAAGQFPEARQRAVGVIEKDPKNVDGLILMGNALAGLKDFEGAVRAMEDAVDAEPNRTLTYSNLSWMELARGNRDAALAALQRAVEIDPKSPRARLSLANFFWASGQAADAQRELKTALELDPKSIDATRALAAFHLARGQRAEAEPYLRAYADLAPDVSGKFVLADFLRMERRTSEATALLDALTKDPAGFAPAQVRLATVDFAAGNTVQAHKRLDEVFARDPQNESATLMKARFLLYEGRPGEALPVATEVATRNPQSASAHFLRGQALEPMGRLEEAIAAFQKVVELRPADASAQIRLATLFLHRGDALTAANLAGQALKNNPGSGVARILLAKSLVRQGNVAAAERDVALLARNNPEILDVQLLLGDYYGARRDFPRSAAAYGRALELEPRSIEALTGLVRVDLARKDYAGAVAKVERQLTARPDEVALLALAGGVYSTVGNQERAEWAYRQIVRLDASNLDAYFRLGALLHARGRLDEARKELEEAARQGPTLAGPPTMLGVILTIQGKHADARSHYERALAINPQAAVAANNLAWDYAENGGNLDVALQLAQTAKSQAPQDAAVNDTLGWIYYKKGLSSAAITAFRDGIAQMPSDAGMRYRLGLAQLQNGDRIEARRSLEQALKLDPSFAQAEDARRTLATIQG